MSRKITLVLLVLLLAAAPVFAQFNLTDSNPDAPLFYSVPYIGLSFPEGEEEDDQIQSIRNNEFFLEIQRLTKLAYDTFDFCDYDASMGFAEEAMRYAELSDEYVSTQLIAEAKRLLEWADENNIVSRYANNYNEAKNYYEAGVALHSEEEFGDAISSSINAIGILASFQGRVIVSVVAATTSTSADSSSSSLPEQYTVRTWARERDCLWNIAGYSWVYGDPWQWKTLYEANKSKLPDPDNPNLIEPGMVLDIPVIKGETRQGMWQAETNTTTTTNNTSRSNWRPPTPRQ
jgi:hypothetical protein